MLAAVSHKLSTPLSRREEVIPRPVPTITGVDRTLWRFDNPLFADRARGRALGLKRSRERAEALAGYLGLDLVRLRRRHPPTVAVVGSKGKGTAAIWASAVLAAAGLRVGTITSPGLRSNRDRIRINGVSIRQPDYLTLVAEFERAMAQAQGSLPEGGYLAPTGVFTLLGVRHFQRAGCDAWVLEAGMGGRSDEISLFTPDVVAVTTIFGEHIGILGDTVAEIADDKLGVVAPGTAGIVSLHQPDADVARAVARAAQGRHLRLVEDVPREAFPLPPGLIGMNARVGLEAGRMLLAQLGRDVGDDALAAVADTIRLPGRLSVHNRGSQIWVVDSAINRTGAAAARSWMTDRVGPPDAVILCLPDDKDVEGAERALSGCTVIQVRADAPHLSFDRTPERMPLLRELDPDSLGRRVLCLGTISFVGEVLDLLKVPTATAFSVPAATPSR